MPEPGPVAVAVAAHVGAASADLAAVRRSSARMCLGRMPDAADSGRDAAQDRDGSQELHQERRLDLVPVAEHAGDHAVLNEDLRALDQAGRKGRLEADHPLVHQIAAAQKRAEPHDDQSCGRGVVWYLPLHS